MCTTGASQATNHEKACEPINCDDTSSRIVKNWMRFFSCRLGLHMSGSVCAFWILGTRLVRIKAPQKLDVDDLTIEQVLTVHNNIQ